MVIFRLIDVSLYFMGNKKCFDITIEVAWRISLQYYIYDDNKIYYFFFFLEFEWKISIFEDEIFVR